MYTFELKIPIFNLAQLKTLTRKPVLRESSWLVLIKHNIYRRKAVNKQ